MINICEAENKKYQQLPEKVLQFGEGNFLRAFADWYVEKANEKNLFSGRVVIAKPTNRGTTHRLSAQNCFYTVVSRGRENGCVIENTDVISSVSRIISCYDDFDELLSVSESPDLSVVISNTTEAGIVYVKGEMPENAPYVSFPAKLTVCLYNRFKKLGFGSGPLILPVELIEDNGRVLKQCVLNYAEEWKLEKDFIQYLNDDCKFCSTLVDRIVTGFPAEEFEKLSSGLGYEDNLLVACEPYHSWIIEGRKEWKEIFPVYKIDGSVVWTDALPVYRERKVKILNGAHTMSVLAAYLGGYDIVRDMMHNDLFNNYIRKGLLEEIIPTINLPKEECEAFAAAVLERFDNPFINHKLLDISLNSVSKFKARCLCSVLDYKNLTGKLPEILVFGLAALIVFYNGRYDENGDFVGTRAGEKYLIQDLREVTDFFEAAYQTGDVVQAVLSNKKFWDIDLTETDGLYNMVKDYFEDINHLGIIRAVKKVVNNG